MNCISTTEPIIEKVREEVNQFVKASEKYREDVAQYSRNVSELITLRVRIRLKDNTPIIIQATEKECNIFTILFS
jgi:hypothetical protein